MKIIQLFTLLIVIYSCNEDVQIEEKEIYVQSVNLPDTVIQGEYFPIEMEISVSGCWTYSRLELEGKEEDVLFKVYVKNSSKSNEDVNCPTGLFKEEVSEKIELNSLGEIRLIFNNSELVREIYVKSQL